LIGFLAFASCATPLVQGDGVAHLEGVDIHYFVAGSGPALVVQPGGPGMEWKYLRMPEVEKFATVVYVDPRGSGASSRLPRLEDYRIDRMVEDLEGLRRHLALPRFALFGHSHGGMVAQIYASRHEARLRKLILCATVASAGPGWYAEMGRNAKARSGEAWYADAAAALASSRPDAGEEEVRERFRRILPFYFYRWEPFREEALRLIDGLRMTPEPQRAFSELDAPGFDARPLLARLRVPTLILAGRHDFACTPERAAEMNGLMPNSRLIVFERSGHFL
jgi:proline iminopeptidase